MDPEIGDLDRGDVLIEDSKIVAVAPSIDAEDCDRIEAGDCIVIPGFVDTHRHTWQAPVRNIAADWNLFHYLAGLHTGLSRHFRPQDTYAIRDDNPVLFLEHKRLYSLKEQWPAHTDDSLGRAVVRRPGTDVTLVSVMKGVHDCLAAAELLAADGIDAEVIDLRTLRPLDRATLLESLARTHALVAVEEGPLTGGWAGEVLAVAAEAGLHDIDDVWRITTPDHPIPYSPVLEDSFLPGGEAIAAAVRDRIGKAAVST
jgi:hypothetical protein